MDGKKTLRKGSGIITAAYSGLGLATVKTLEESGRWHVIMACRDFLNAARAAKSKETTQLYAHRSCIPAANEASFSAEELSLVRFHEETGITYVPMYPGCISTTGLFREQIPLFRLLFPPFQKYITKGFVSKEEVGKRLAQV
ncbi:hypothetical protein CRYUN_Cryun38cG0051400 [Craigia yunnanensis]